MKTTLVLFLSACLYAAATRSQTGTKNVSVDNVTLSDGKFVEQKLCTSSTAANEITSLKKEVKQLKEVLLQRLDELLRRLGKTTITFLVLMIYLCQSVICDLVLGNLYVVFYASVCASKIEEKLV